MVCPHSTPECCIHLFTSVREFTGCILQAQKEKILKGARKDYKPYWNDDLDKQHIELNAARDLSEYVPKIQH